jgi:Fe-Mn family superoxide dismutase
MVCPDSGNTALGEGSLLNDIETEFGSFDEFKASFEEAATSVFGSGWAWLCRTSSRDLKITTTPNQESPLMYDDDDYCIPLFGLDVWEHAYYLDHMWERANYITDFWRVVDWRLIESFYLDYVREDVPIPVA